MLHSADTALLFCACEALKSLVSPLEYRAVYIPLLPAPLMSADEVRTLLVDCSTPYLIGVDSALLASLWPRAAKEAGGGSASAAPAALAPHAVIVDLDSGAVSHAATTRWFRATQAPVLSLVRELSGCMGDMTQFKQAAVQAACLRFVVDTVNLGAAAVVGSVGIVGIVGSVGSVVIVLFHLVLFHFDFVAGHVVTAHL